MKISKVGEGKVVLIASPQRCYTDVAARFVRSERDIEDIASSPEDEKIIRNILNSGHTAATEFDYYLFGIQGFARVTEVQLVRKRLASYMIKSGRVDLDGKREFSVVLPKGLDDIYGIATVGLDQILVGDKLLKDYIELTGEEGATVFLNTRNILNVIESWYDIGVKEGYREEDLRYMKPQATEFKALIGMNCYSEDTEVLTSRGWVLFRDLLSTDTFYSLNPDTHKVDILPAENLIRQEYVGKMVSVETSSISLLTTPEHNNLVSYAWKKSERKFTLDQAKNMGTHKNISMLKSCQGVNGTSMQDIFILPEVNNKQIHYNGNLYPAKSVPMRGILKLIGIFLSDGSVFHQGQNETTKCGIIISNSNYGVLSTYKELIDSWLGTDCKLYETSANCYNMHVYSPQLYMLFKDFGKALEKRIPDFAWGLDAELLHHLYLGLLDGDASKTRTHKTLFTSSEGLANDFQRLLLHIGKSGTLGVVDRRGMETAGVDSKGNSYKITTKNLEYRVSVNDKKNSPFIKQYNKSPVTEIDYAGYVYCVELPKNHTLYVRRKGKTVWSGNCHAILDWLKIRDCNNAQTEIRGLAREIKRLCKADNPVLFEKAGASCISLGYCPENDRQNSLCTDKIMTHTQVLELIKSNK